LERLDLRDNDLSDPTEIARLTAIPYLREIWVSGNPFTKTHSNYRVSIFNLFRKTPGFSEDIIIDATGPGYSEKKQLVDRVVEPEGAPVVRPFERDETPVADKTVHPILNTSASIASEIRLEKPASSVIVHNEPAVGSRRRRRGHRRRIVDLSHDDPCATKELVGSETIRPVIKQSASDLCAETTSGEDLRTSKKPDRTLSSPSSGTARSREVSKPSRVHTSAHLIPAIEGVDWDIGGDLYRQRLEALKQEVGSNWLTVLDDETWDGKRKEIGVLPNATDFNPTRSIRPTPVTRTTSQIIVTSGRTLG
jgi:hypothetical protein